MPISRVFKYILDNVEKLLSIQINLEIPRIQISLHHSYTKKLSIKVRFNFHRRTPPPPGGPAWPAMSGSGLGLERTADDIHLIYSYHSAINI